MNVKIKYNNQIISEFDEGKKILKCANKDMLTDVEVSFVDEVIIPTDLTGYKVYVPSGWSCDSGFGEFNLIFDVENDYYENFSLGYSISSSYDPFLGSTSYSLVPTQNNCVMFEIFKSNSFFPYSEYSLNSSFTLSNIIGGSDVTNQDLIQWFVDNGATFEYNYEKLVIGNDSGGSA